MKKRYGVWVNPEESKIVQETLFKLGYAWNGTGECIVKHTDAPVIGIWDDNTITYGHAKYSGDITFEQFKLKHKLISKMKEFKIKVNPRQSKVVQEKCFEHGRLWQGTIAVVKNVVEPHLYSYDNCITFTSDDNSKYFDKHKLPELTFDEFLIEYGLPNSFAIKCIRHPLWDKYVKWWRSEFDSHYYTGEDNKYYGFKSSSRVITNAFIDARLPDDCIELTLEQWDNIVNKTNKINNMKYKLVKREYLTAVSNILFGNTILVWTPNADFTVEDEEIIQKLTAAGVMHWFEEVKDEYKVGDYITVVEECKPYNGEVGKTYKVTMVENTHLAYDEYNSIPTTSVKVRLATKDEIKEYELLEEARRRYPVGTKFHPAHMKKSKDYCIVTNDKFVFRNDGSIETPTDSGAFWDVNCSLKYGGTTHNRRVYHDGVWARIVDEESIRIEKLLEKANNDYPIGTKYKSVDSSCSATIQGELDYDKEDDLITDGWGGLVYIDGKWAEIIPNAPDITIAGRKIEYLEGYIKIGCTDVYLTTIKELVKLPIDFISIRGHEAVSILTLQQIVDYYETL